MIKIILKDVELLSIVEQYKHHRGKVTVVFDDNNEVVISIKKLLIHLMFFTILRKWNIPITSDMLVKIDTVTDSVIGDICTKIFDKVSSLYEESYKIVYDIGAAVNILNNFIINNCQEYHQSLSILDMVKIADIPEIKAITDDKVSNIDISVQKTNEHIKANFNRLYDALKKPHPDNVIRNFINLRFVKSTALAHIFYQVGFRTDIDDNAIRYPIVGNYLDGLRNTTEYCLEALSAKKATFYNQDSIKTAEYFGRKQHILLSSIRYMYKGDCGTDIVMPFHITEHNANMVLYKNIVDHGNIVTLTKNNIKNYIGTIVDFRTPAGCRYNDGICEICGGKLLANMPPHTHVGMFSGIQATANITQVILSAKHVQDTSIVEYVVPNDLKNYLIKLQGGIYVKPKYKDKFSKIMVVFDLNDTLHLREATTFNVERVDGISEMSFGVCKSIILMKNNVPISEQISLGSNEQYPLYSKPLIRYIIEQKDNIIIRDNMFMIPMTDFDFKNPIFKLNVVSNSMVKFVDNAKKLLESQIKKYDSVTKLTNDFTSLVYKQVNPNIAYLEVMIRAALIRNNHDYQVPVIDDIDKVTFTTNPIGNMRRSIGILCAFQQLPSSLRNPELYVVPRTFTPFDEFLNLKPAKEVFKNYGRYR